MKPSQRQVERHRLLGLADRDQGDLAGLAALHRRRSPARSRPKRAKQPTWLHQANGYCRCSPPSICSTTPLGESVPSGVTTVTPASASALLRQLQDADLGDRVLLRRRAASWYMKHSLPSGAQRTCQSPKVSRTISITSGLAGSPRRGRLARRARRGRAGAAPAGASAAGASPAGAARSAAAAGASGAAPGRRASRPPERRLRAAVSCAASGAAQRQPERRPGSGGSGSVASAARIPSDCVPRNCHPAPRLSTRRRRDGLGEARAQVKRAPEGALFPACATSLSDWPNDMRGRYDRYGDQVKLCLRKVGATA